MAQKKQEVQEPQIKRDSAVRTVTNRRTAEFAAWACKRMRVTQNVALEVALRLLRDKIEEECPDEVVPEMDTGEYDFADLPE